MCRSIAVRRTLASLLAVAVTLSARPLTAADDGLTAEAVLTAITRGQRYLVSRQKEDGSWSAGPDMYKTGVTSLALLALLNSGMTKDDPDVREALRYLRSIKEPEPGKTYEISVMLMALAAARDGGRDKSRMIDLAAKLEKIQIEAGGPRRVGGWGYGDLGLGGLASRPDRSNSQFALLALRDAAHAGVKVDRATWQRAREYWVNTQNRDGADFGGWGYAEGLQEHSTGSMTVAGISSLVIINAMLKDDGKMKDGKPDCCSKQEPDENLQRGIRWLERNFAVTHNPGRGGWLLYYLYGLERAGRLSGRRFFGKDNDWYRRGAAYLLRMQSPRLGAWLGQGHMEREPVIGTSFALLFLSKGLAPVLINKLKYGPADADDPLEIAGDNWNRHPTDVRNLTEHVSTLEKWPGLLTWQTVEIRKAVREERTAEGEGVGHLLQAPVLVITGHDEPQSLLANDDQVRLLREYINQGGFIFAVGNCKRDAGFDAGFRELVRRMFADDPQAKLKRLGGEHPVYRVEYNLAKDAENIELWGLDYG